VIPFGEGGNPPNSQDFETASRRDLPLARGEMTPQVSPFCTNRQLPPLGGRVARSGRHGPAEVGDLGISQGEMRRKSPVWWLTRPSGKVPGPGGDVKIPQGKMRTRVARSCKGTQWHMGPQHFSAAWVNPFAGPKSPPGGGFGSPGGVKTTPERGPRQPKTGDGPLSKVGFGGVRELF